MMEPDLGVYARIWFAQAWRILLRMAFGLIALTGFLFVFAMASMAIAGSAEVKGLVIAMNAIGGVAGFAIGFWAWLRAFRATMNMRFGDYRLELRYDPDKKEGNVSPSNLPTGL